MNSAGAATAPALSPEYFEAREMAARAGEARQADARQAQSASRGFETIEGGAHDRGGPQGLPSYSPKQPGYQQTLFREGGFREGGPNNKVVAIPTMTPLRPQVREAQTRRAPRTPAPRPHRNGTLSRPQQELQFGGEPELAASGEVICCDAPVALPAHRMLAAVTDASMVLIGTGVFMGVFLLSGGEIGLNRQTIPLLVGVVMVLALFYRVLWCIADGDTPGMRFAGLRLVDFDGRRPTREMRGLRQAAGLLSLLSGGLGLVWALVDEESLTWHDHISKTFPTAD